MYIAFGGVYQFSAAVIGIAVFFALVAYRRRISRLFEKEEKIVFRRVFYAKGGVNMGLQVSAFIIIISTYHISYIIIFLHSSVYPYALHYRHR